MSRNTSRIRLAVAAIVVEVILAGMLTFQVFPSVWAVGNAVFDYDQSAGPDRGINLAEVADHPETMWGRTVTISATVEKIISPQMMRIGRQSLFIDEEVLILAPAPLDTLLEEGEPGPIATGDVARVTGLVRRYEPDALATELSLDPTAQGFRAYGGKSVLVAEQIELNPPRAVGPGDKDFSSGSDGFDIGITSFDLANDPGGKYIGKVVTVSGEIENVFASTHALHLSDHKLLVVTDEPRPDLFVEATAYVTGTVRLFELNEIESELGMDLDDDEFAQYQGEVVIVAELIDLVA